MKGEPPKGQAAAQYSDVLRTYSEEALDALQKQKIPAAYKEYLLNYYDAIRLDKIPASEKK